MTRNERNFLIVLLWVLLAIPIVLVNVLSFRDLGIASAFTVFLYVVEAIGYAVTFVIIDSY